MRILSGFTVNLYKNRYRGFRGFLQRIVDAIKGRTPQEWGVQNIKILKNGEVLNMGKYRVTPTIFGHKLIVHFNNVFFLSDSDVIAPQVNTTGFWTAEVKLHIVKVAL